MPTTTAQRIQYYAPKVLAPNMVGLVAVALIAFVIYLFTPAHAGDLFELIALGWFVLNLVPLSASSAVASDSLTGAADPAAAPEVVTTTIGFLPLLPAILFVVYLSRRYWELVRVRVSIRDLIVLAASALLVPLALSAVAWGVLALAADSNPVTVASPWGLVKVLLLHGFALALGMRLKLWRAVLNRYNWPRELADSTLQSWFFLQRVAVVATVAFAVAWLFRLRLLDDVMSVYNGPFSAAGLTLVSIAYLPNAALATAAVLLGSEFHVGAASVSLYASNLLTLPPIPLAIAAPTSVPVWALGLVALPTLLSLRQHLRWLPTIAQACYGTVAVVGLAALWGFLGSGELGFYGETGVMVALTAGLAGLWFGIVGLLVAVLVRINTRQAPSGAVREGAPMAAEVPSAESDAADDAEGEVDDAEGEVDDAEGEGEEATAADENAVEDERAVDGKNGADDVLAASDAEDEAGAQDPAGANGAAGAKGAADAQDAADDAETAAASGQEETEEVGVENADGTPTNASEDERDAASDEAEIDAEGGPGEVDTQEVDTQEADSEPDAAAPSPGTTASDRRA